MKCKDCIYNLGDVCQASLPDSQLDGCDPFDDDDGGSEDESYL